jgi:hypothetical protein
MMHDSLFNFRSVFFRHPVYSSHASFLLYRVSTYTGTERVDFVIFVKHIKNAIPVCFSNLSE